MALGDMLGGILGVQPGQKTNNAQNYGYGNGQNPYDGNGQYNQNQQQNNGQVPPNYDNYQSQQQGYNNQQQGYGNNNEPQMGVLGNGQWQIQRENELYAKCTGTGMMFAKKGKFCAVL